jgi:hypothetical protein
MIQSIRTLRVLVNAADVAIMIAMVICLADMMVGHS